MTSCDTHSHAQRRAAHGHAHATARAMNPPLPATAQHSSSCGLRSSTSSSDGPPSFVLYDPPGLLCSEAPSFRENVWRNDDPMMWGSGDISHLARGARTAPRRRRAEYRGSALGGRTRNCGAVARSGATTNCDHRIPPKTNVQLSFCGYRARYPLRGTRYPQPYFSEAGVLLPVTVGNHISAALTEALISPTVQDRSLLF